MVEEKKKMTKGEKKDKPKKEKSSKKDKVVAPVPEVVEETTEPIVVSESVVETETATETATENVMEEEDDFDKMFKALEDFRITSFNYMKEQKLTMKKMEKEYKKMYKRFNKKKKTRSVSAGVSGLHKPQKISDKLCEFLGVPAGTDQSYQEVLKGVHGYINEKNLKNPNNGKEVLVDSKLEELLQANGEPVYFFGNLHKLLKPHYLKNE